MKMPGKMVPFLLGMMGKKTDTISYPLEEAPLKDKFRGMLKFNHDLCVGCRLCERVCPADAIKIIAAIKIAAAAKTDEASNNAGAERRRFEARLSLGKCIFCGQCADSCNKKALENTMDFELARAGKDSLEVDL